MKQKNVKSKGKLICFTTMSKDHLIPKSKLHEVKMLALVVIAGFAFIGLASPFEIYRNGHKHGSHLAVCLITFVTHW